MKPKSITLIKGLLFIKLALIALVVIVFFFVKDMDSSQRTFLTGVKEGITEQLLNNIDSSPDYLFGRLLGLVFIPVILCLLQIYFIRERKFLGILITVIIDVLFGLSQGFPLFALIILVTILTQPTKNYLKRTNEDVSQQNQEEAV